VSDIKNIYRCTPRQIQGFIEDVFFAGLVPFVRSSPGMGKSSIFRKVSDKLNLKMIDHRLSTSEPTDLSGLPQFVDGYARFAPFAELFPLENTPIPNGKDGWCVFLDEYNAATKQVRAASFKLLLDKMVGQHPLHPQVVIGMAGNLDTDRSITSIISTAEQSRLIHLEMMLNFGEFMEDVAILNNWDPRIIAYLNQYESKLMDFRPDHDERTFCCPRTWEFVHRLIVDREVTDNMAPLLAGTITSGTAVEFVQFCQIYKNLVTIRQILADPKVCPVPWDVNLKWATISHMMEKVTEDNFDDLSTYANRFDLAFRVLFFRSAMIRHKHLRQHPAFSKAMIELSRYLNG
jgi:hypothetical protein